MSKQSEAKEAQGYTREPASCANCVQFRSVIEKTTDRWGYTRVFKTDLRCAIGGFKVHKTAFCNEFARKPSEA